MSMTFKVNPGNRRVLKQIEQGDRRIRRGIRQGWFAVGKDWKADTNAEIKRKPKSGRVYMVRGPSGRRRRHVASAPGETHANLSGKLRRSLSWKAHGHSELEVGYGVAVSRGGRNAPPGYDPFVEFGTGKMAARPSVLNGINSVQRNAEQHLAKGVAREMAK